VQKEIGRKSVGAGPTPELMHDTEGAGSTQDGIRGMDTSRKSARICYYEAATRQCLDKKEAKATGRHDSSPNDFQPVAA